RPHGAPPPPAAAPRPPPPPLRPPDPGGFHPKLKPVDPGHPDPDPIPPLEHPAVPLPLQDHLLLMEPEAVPRKRLDLHQAVDEILAQLDEETERVDRQDEALELLPDPCDHERRLLPVDQLTFRLV